MPSLYVNSPSFFLKLFCYFNSGNEVFLMPPYIIKFLIQAGDASLLVLRTGARTNPANAH